MKSYMLPIGLASAGVAMLIHYKTDHQKKVSPLPSTPTSHWRGGASLGAGTSSAATANLKIDSTQKIDLKDFQKFSEDKKKSVLFDQPYEFFHNRLINLTDCLETKNCPYPNRDPKEYEIFLNAEAKTTLEALTTWQKRHHLKDERITYLMIDFLSFEDASVKKEALNILLTQNPDRLALNPILENVIEYPQPEAIPAGMEALQRYRSVDNRKKIDDTFEQVLRNGAVNSAEAIAKNLKPFITDKNWNRYDKIRDDLSRSPLSESIFISLTHSLDN